MDAARSNSVLLGGLRHPDAEVRARVAAALGELRVPAAEAELAWALVHDPSPDVRSACAEALGALGARAALVDAAATEPDPFVVILIERALWTLDRQRRQSRSTGR